MRVSNSSLDSLTNEVDELSETDVSWLVLVGGRERPPRPALPRLVIDEGIERFNPARLEERRRD